MNNLWFFLTASAVLYSLFAGTGAAVESAAISGMQNAVGLAIELLGPMAFWSGMIKILSDAGATGRLSRLLSPLLVRLMPSLGTDKETGHAVIENISANLLGLGNAATPRGLAAMKSFKSARDAGLFVLINTTGFSLLPTTMLSLRAAAGSVAPASVVPYVWLTSLLTLSFALLLGVLTAGRSK